MRENKNFLNYILMGKYDYYVVIYDNKYRYIILLNLVFGGENNFSMMLSIGKVRRVKRYGRYLSMQEYGVKVFIFLSGYVLAKILVLGIIFSSKGHGQFSH